MESQGYKAGEIFNRNVKHLKLITALGDLDVRQKIESKDLDGFLNLCKEKGYAENYSGNILEWISTKNAMKMIDGKYTNLVITRGEDDGEQIDDGDHIVIPIVVWAVVVAAEFYYLMHVYKTVAWTKNQGVNPTPPPATEQAYVNVALLTEDEKTAFMVCDKYITHEVEIIVEAIRKENPNLTNSQVQELTNFLKKNIVQLNEIIENDKNKNKE